MLANFMIAVNAVVPLFLLILLGMGARSLHLLTDTELKHVNRAIFTVMFPLMMFYNIYSSDLSGSFDPGYIGFGVVMTLIVHFLGMGVALIVEKDNRSRGALIQGIYRGNVVLMGLPIMINLMGEEARGLTAVMVAVIVPCYNILAVITLEVFRGGKPDIRDMGRRIVTNPLIIGAVLGILANLAGLKLPSLIEEPLGDVSSAATVVALLVMGASFHVSSVRENLRNLIIGVLGKLVLSPALALLAGYAIGLRGIPLALLLIIFGAPCAVSGYTMAQQMDSNGELAAGCLIFTSLFSCVTICGWIFLLEQIGAI
ncbi:MAG: AEC family transporter [Lachnospiraceae bacterium]|nr:AEC family transporter [Lachnospiraceae bacterium]